MNSELLIIDVENTIDRATNDPSFRQRALAVIGGILMQDEEDFKVNGISPMIIENSKRLFGTELVNAIFIPPSMNKSVYFSELRNHILRYSINHFSDINVEKILNNPIMEYDDANMLAVNSVYLQFKSDNSVSFSRIGSIKLVLLIAEYVLTRNLAIITSELKFNGPPTISNIMLYISQF